MLTHLRKRTLVLLPLVLAVIILAVTVGGFALRAPGPAPSSAPKTSVPMVAEPAAAPSAPSADQVAAEERSRRIAEGLAKGTLRPATEADLVLWIDRYATMNPTAGQEPMLSGDADPRAFLIGSGDEAQEPRAFVLLAPFDFVARRSAGLGADYLFLAPPGAELRYDGRSYMPAYGASAPSQLGDLSRVTDAVLSLETGAYAMGSGRDAVFGGFIPPALPAAPSDTVGPDRPATPTDLPMAGFGPSTPAIPLPAGITAYPGNTFGEIGPEFREDCTLPKFVEGTAAIVVGAYGPAVPGESPVEVVVPAADAPAVLVLTSFEPIVWTIAAERPLAAVIAYGFAGVRVAGVPKDVPIVAARTCNLVLPDYADTPSEARYVVRSLQKRFGLPTEGIVSRKAPETIVLPARK